MFSLLEALIIDIYYFLVGFSPWGHKESDTTALLHFTLQSLTYALRFFNKWLDILSNMEHGLARNNKVEIGSNYLPGYSWSSQSVQSLSCVRLFATPWTTARQASLSISNSRSLLKLMSIESVTPSNHLILWTPSSSCLQSFPASGSFPVSQFFTSGGQSIEVSASASVFPMNIQG